MQFRVESLRVSFESLFRQANNCGNDKTCEIYLPTGVGTLRDIFVTTMRKSTPQERGGTSYVGVDVFVVPLISSWEARELISDAISSSVARGIRITRASRTGRESHHAHEPLYVAQGCSSSGSLLCRVVASPADTHIHQIALWSLHVICNNLIVLVREISVDSRHTMSFWFEVLLVQRCWVYKIIGRKTNMT